MKSVSRDQITELMQRLATNLLVSSANKTCAMNTRASNTFNKRQQITEQLLLARKKL
jgi:hypothetical protein